MLAGDDLLLSAWDGDKLVAVCRALTDYSYCCYLSDLAVNPAYQKQGIGKRLVDELRTVIGDEVSLILLAAPEAITYYPKIGVPHADNAFVLRRKR